MLSPRQIKVIELGESTMSKLGLSFLVTIVLEIFSILRSSFGTAKSSNSVGKLNWFNSGLNVISLSAVEISQIIPSER